MNQAIRWLALLAGGISFGLEAVLLYLFLRLRKMGRENPHHVARMAVSHLGLTLAGCGWLLYRIVEHPADLFVLGPFLLVMFVVSNAGLLGLLWDEYQRSLTPHSLTRGEAEKMFAGVVTQAEKVQLLKERDETWARFTGRLDRLEAALAAAGEAAKKKMDG